MDDGREKLHPRRESSTTIQRPLHILMAAAVDLRLLSLLPPLLNSLAQAAPRHFDHDPPNLTPESESGVASLVFIAARLKVAPGLSRSEADLIRVCLTTREDLQPSGRTFLHEQALMAAAAAQDFAELQTLAGALADLLGADWAAEAANEKLCHQHGVPRDLVR